ncbi:MAG: flavodoxin domain-containing protein [bacterium]
MKTLICYRSKYGSTRQYAEWLHKEVKSDLVDIEKEHPDFKSYDVIVFGGYLRMGKIVIAQNIKNNWDKIENKEILFFTTSGLPVGHPLVKKAYENSLQENMRRKIKYFPLRGRQINRNLSLLDKLLMFVGSSMEKDEETKKGMRTDFDEVKPDSLRPLLNYLRAKENERAPGK